MLTTDCQQSILLLHKHLFFKKTPNIEEWVNRHWIYLYNHVGNN